MEEKKNKRITRKITKIRCLACGSIIIDKTTGEDFIVPCPKCKFLNITRRHLKGE